ncbi:MAG TPA: winged helix-turn-helix domain-containing protein, partial [Nitrosopumilaceae archaeon]|nr:winged helix-turn-helix domain-containing protein [Nitrosopumilaceae archaeon]
HSRLSKFIDNLTGANLINKIEFDGKNAFVITPKGKQYLESYKNFQTLADTFGLDL